jgi:hypothetical protein
MSGIEQLVRLLLEYGANKDARDCEGNTAAGIANILDSSQKESILSLLGEGDIVSSFLLQTLAIDEKPLAA